MTAQDSRPFHKAKLEQSDEAQQPSETSSHAEDKKLSSKTSISNVNFCDYIKMEWKSDKRVVAGVRVNEELYKEFKSVSKQLYGSTCRAVEFFMASVVLSARNKVNFSHTQQPIQIGEINIMRNLRPRRSLPFQDFEKASHDEAKDVVRVERSKRPVKFIDYRGLSDKILVRRYLSAKRRVSVVDSMMCAGELKARGNGLYERAQIEFKLSLSS